MLVVAMHATQLQFGVMAHHTSLPHVTSSQKSPAQHPVYDHPPQSLSHVCAFD